MTCVFYGDVKAGDFYHERKTKFFIFVLTERYDGSVYNFDCLLQSGEIVQYFGLKYDFFLYGDVVKITT
jgi:hypothetical protein